jgi:membrane-associated phospholipid phosphatase
MLVFKIPKGHRLQSYSRVLLAGLTAYLLAKLAASVYQPDIARPFELLGQHAGALFLNNPGFPSDHTLFATAITCAVWFETRNKPVSLLLAGLVVLISVGRVLALVHTPVDVIFGIIFGLLGSLWYLNSKPDVYKSTSSLHK